MGNDNISNHATLQEQISWPIVADRPLSSDVAFGSFASFWPRAAHFWSSPTSGHNRGLRHVSKVPIGDPTNNFTALFSVLT